MEGDSALNLPEVASGQTYLADRRPPARPRWLILLLFLSAFGGLQGAWHAAAGSAFERLVIDAATVRPAVAVINVVTPRIGAEAQSFHIRAPGGGINILNGCDGLDVLFLLTAALLAVPLPWRRRLFGTFVGGAMVYALNLLRILALFYAYRYDRVLFDLLHGTLAPLILIALVTLFFVGWTETTRAPP